MCVQSRYVRHQAVGQHQYEGKRKPRPWSDVEKGDSNGLRTLLWTRAVLANGRAASTCEHHVQGDSEGPRVPRADAAARLMLLNAAGFHQHLGRQELRCAGPRVAAEARALLTQPACPADTGAIGAADNCWSSIPSMKYRGVDRDGAVSVSLLHWSKKRWREDQPFPISARQMAG